MKNLKFGFSHIDDENILDKSDLLVIGGRPGMGKTSLVLNIIIRNKKAKGLYISLKETEYKILDKIKNIKSVQKTMYPLKELEVEQLEMEEIQMICLENPKFIELVELIVSNKNEYDYFVLDELTEIDGKINPLFSKNKNYYKIIRHLKALANALDKNIILLSNLNKKIEKKGKKKFNYLYYGNQEKYIDYLMVIHRPDYYGIYKNKFNEEYSDGECTLYFAKSKRKAPSSEYIVTFNGNKLLFL